MTIEDLYAQNRRLWVRLREKGGKRHAIPCHHNLECLVAYPAAVGLREDPKQPSFRAVGRGPRQAHSHNAATGQRLRDNLPPRGGSRHRRPSSATTASGRPGTAYLKNSSTPEKPPRWRTMPRGGRRSATISGPTSQASMRSSGL